MSTKSFNAFAMAQAQFDRIAESLELDQGTRDLLRQPMRAYHFSRPVRMDDGRVAFEDVNGPRGGPDVQCRLKLLRRPRGEVDVSATAIFAGHALSTAAQRASRCVTSRIRRRWMLRRCARSPLKLGSAA